MDVPSLHSRFLSDALHRIRPDARVARLTRRRHGARALFGISGRWPRRNSYGVRQLGLNSQRVERGLRTRRRTRDPSAGHPHMCRRSWVSGGGSHSNYYLVESARADGKPRIVSQQYLGAADEVLAKRPVSRGLTPGPRHTSPGLVLRRSCGQLRAKVHAGIERWPLESLTICSSQGPFPRRREQKRHQVFAAKTTGDKRAARRSPP
jgi:hypothetical protein